MTKAKAKKLCLIKWKYAMEKGSDNCELRAWLYTNHPEVYKLKNVCAYCDKYRYDWCDRYGWRDCQRCPLYRLWKMTCCEHDSLFKRWINCYGREEHKKYATIIYEDIKRS